MAEFPALPLYTDAYLGDTMHLTLEQHGAYLKLIIIAWRSRGCCLPDDDAKLSTMLGVSLARWKTKLRPAIEPFWAVVDGRWTQKKLTEVRAHVEKVSQKRREARAARDDAKPLEPKETAPANAPPNEPVTKTKTKTKESNHDKTESHEPPLAASPPQSAKSHLWQEMVEFYGGPSSRSLIGRWCRDWDEGEVFAAYFATAKAHNSSELPDVRGYTAGILSRRPKKADQRRVNGTLIGVEGQMEAASRFLGITEDEDDAASVEPRDTSGTFRTSALYRSPLELN